MSPSIESELNAEVLTFDSARREAMLAGDVDALDRLLADDAVWIHASSSIDTKASFIEGIKSGRLQCFRFDQEYLSVRLYGPVALLSGVVDLEVAAPEGKRRSSRSRYTCAWVGDQGRFRMVFWQSTRMADHG
jgi:ketosteroid isomerase-like protein